MAKYTIRYNELVEYEATFETDVKLTRDSELMDFFRGEGFSEVDLDAEENSAWGPDVDSMQLIMVDDEFI